MPAKDGNIVFQGDFLAVTRDEIPRPGAGTSIRETVLRPEAVAIVALTASDEIILVRQYRHATGGELAEIPAGLVDPGESRQQAAMRELLEETGFATAVIQEIVRYFPAAGYANEQVTLFYAPNCRPAPGPAPRGEPATPLLISLDRLPDLLPGGKAPMCDGKSLIGLSWLHARLLAE